LILWCTHYPFLEDFIRKAIGPEVSLIDPAKEAVLQVKKILNIRGILNSRNRQANHSFFIRGDINKFRNAAENLLKRKIKKLQYD